MAVKIWVGLWGAVLALGCSEGSKPDTGQSEASVSLDGSGGQHADGGNDTSATGEAGGSTAPQDGGLPGCEPSPCDAYDDKNSCEGADSACIWLEVRVIPNGETCDEGYNEERCLDYRGSASTGGCWGALTECGATSVIANTERGTVVARSTGCGSFPTCFRYCDPKDQPLCDCGCETSQH